MPKDSAAAPGAVRGSWYLCRGSPGPPRGPSLIDQRSAITLDAFLPALPWLLGFLLFPRLRRRHPRLEDAPAGSGRRVTMIVPARNESATIDMLLTSLRASTYPDFEILVVDDQSTDDTGARVAAHAAQDARVRLLRGAPLPEGGWFGKPWACLQGARTATGDLLLFTDADTTHHPHLLSRAVGDLEASGADLLTVMGQQRCDSFWERVIQPMIFALLTLRFRPETVNAARRARDVIANGQFILTLREAYEAVGTHAIVRGEVAEDLVLAQRFFQAGKRVRFVYALSLFSTRMYRDLRGLVEGWSKNVFVGGKRSWPDEPVLRWVTPGLLLLAPLLLLVPPVVLLLNLGGADLYPLAALLATIATVAFFALVDLGVGVAPVYALAFPLGAVVLEYIFLRSVLRGDRRIEWRGRTYGKVGVGE